jgi:hypothetical protein
MTDLIVILGTLLEFFAFVVLTTAVVCVPVALFLWGSELLELIGRRRIARRRVFGLIKIA